MPEILGSTRETRIVQTILCNYKNENHIKKRCQKSTRGNRFQRVWCSNSWWIIIKITWSHRIKISKILRTLYKALEITSYLSKHQLANLKEIPLGVLSHISMNKGQNYRSPLQLFKMRLIPSSLKIILPWLWINNFKRRKLNNKWSLQQAERVHRVLYSKKAQPRLMLYKKLIMGDLATVSQSNK